MSRRYGHRRLRLANSGRWYVALTIGFGVVAISSGNNVLYLLESLLLGGLILSGVLSERAVAVVEVAWRRKPSIVHEENSDLMIVKNRSRLPLFCIEIGEWVNGQMMTRTFLAFLGGRSQVVIPGRVSYEKRGVFRWDGISFATQYPFGFAKKIRWIESPGKRTIWPARSKAVSRKRSLRDQRVQSSETQSQTAEMTRLLGQSFKHGSAEFADGEIRPLQPGDDYRDAVWTLSATRGEPVVRQRQSERAVREVFLDLRQNPGTEFEHQVSEAADVFYRDGGGVLLVADWSGTHRIEGMKAALDALALAQAVGKTRSGAKVA